MDKQSENEWSAQDLFDLKNAASAGYSALLIAAFLNRELQAVEAKAEALGLRIRPGLAMDPDAPEPLPVSGAGMASAE